MDIVGRDFLMAGGRIERIPGCQGFADCMRIAFSHPDSTQPGVLILGHLDTVHPIGTVQRLLPWRREGQRCWGPGILDMKGGIFLCLEAIRQLRAASIQTHLPVTVLLTSDEEVGSPSTRDLIEAEASRHKYVLVPERARDDGGVVTARYAIARFHLRALGLSSHAGHSVWLTKGHSAIREMIEKIQQIEGMTSEDCTFSVGVLHGGQFVNCVPPECTGEALSMAKRQDDLDRAVSQMLALSSPSFIVTRGVTRPVWERDARGMALYETARALAESLRFELPHQSSGGGSDGNFTGAMGIPTLDGLGAKGEGQHTLGEHIEVASLAERGRLMAGLLATLR
jgi:glutamate carboxypeptidase